MPRTLSTRAHATALDAARSIVLEDGLGGLSFEALARRSGVAKSTLYRHWPCRVDLLVHTLVSLVAPFEIPDTGSLHGDLSHCFAEAESRPDPQVRRLFFMLCELATVDPAFGHVRQALLDERTEPVRIALHAAVERGELGRETDIELAVDVVIGPHLSMGLIRDQPIDPETSARLV